MATKSVVSLVVTGQVGLNLQATKSAAGAFVDSFYRGTNLDTGVEYKLPAESILGVDLFGAIILTVDGKDVSALAAMDICRLISSANRPLTLEFLQHDQEVHGSLSVINYASLPWMLEHLEVLERENFEIPNESLSLLRGKLLCYVECERVLSNMDLLKTGQHGKLTLFLKSLMTPFPELISITSFPDCDHNLIEIASSLKDDLDKDFFPLFRESLSMRRMQGYLHRSHSCNNLSFTDLLTNSTAKMYLFLFMSRSNRRHVILLCYLQLRFLDSHASVSDALVLASSALELCKEPYLQVLRNRVIILMDNLRLHGGFTPHLPLSSKRTATSGSVPKNLTDLHQMAVELLFEIADCLAWEHIITIFPSFQISRDNASMDVNLIKSDISCAADICFKRGSSNELLRSRKIPNSVTVHRREKIVEAHNSDSTNPINVVMFDTFVDANGSESDANASDRLIGADIDEDDCAMARVKTKGSVESFIISSLEELRCTREDTLDPGIKLALSPFLVPTGRPCITFKNSNISLPDGEHPPSPKLFSMVLSARDQTDIYACSLVLYRSVLLKKIPLTIKVANKVQLDKADSTMQLKKDSGKTISNSSLNEFLTRPAAVGSQGRECATFVDDVDNVPQASPLQPGTVESSPCYISLTNAGIEDLSNAALSLKKVSRIVASDLAAVLPTELDKLSTVQSDCSPESINLQTTISCPDPKVGPSQFFSNFSDDESAGLLSSTTEDIPTAARIEQVNLEINPKISQSVNAQKQGSFAEFLSATATVTASMASAIAIQAGSLPTTKFSWVTPTFNQAASTTDSKRFYDNLNFSRFKTMTFANAQSARQGDAAYGSSLKRKFDEYPAGESITYKLSGNSPLLDSSSSHQLTSPSSAISSAHSESPIFPLRKDNSASTATFHFSPDKQSLSSYPRFGHIKALKRSAVSPHNSSRSPRHKSITRHQSRRSRVSNLHSTVDIGLSSRGSKNHIPSSKPIHKLNLLACPSHEKLLIPTLIADMDALDLAISDSMLTTAASQSTTEDNLASVNDSAVAIAEAETPGVSFVAHGVFLFTKDPLIEKLRAAAAAIALDYEDHYMHSDTIWTIPKSVSVGLMDSFCMNLNPTTVPTSITSKRNDCSTPDYNSAVVLEALSAKNLVTVLIAFLLEYRIVVVSSKSLSAATHLGEWLKDAIRPLNYTHVYSPLVPPNIGLQLIHCPAPFFIGMKRSSLIDEVVELEDERDREKNKGRRNKSSSNRDNSGCGLLVVDMDRDECSIPLDLCTPVRAARVLIRALELILHPQLSHCDELIMLKPSKSALHTADNVMHLCKTFVNSMLLGSKLCSLDVDDGEEKIVLFDEVLFIQQHLTRISLGTEALALLSARQIKVKEDKVQGGRDFVKAAEDENGRIDIKTFLPATAGGAKDFEKLLRSLLRTQSFSSYLTS